MKLVIIAALLNKKAYIKKEWLKTAANTLRCFCKLQILMKLRLDI